MVLSEVGEPWVTRLLVCDGPLLLATLSVSESTGSRYEADVLGQLARPARVALRAERSRTDLETRLHRARERWNLTPRHVDALRSLALGHSNKELAAALHVTRRTAEQHVADMLARTGSESRLQLVSRLWRES
jgi:DNA-binding NarL/FixJ family response regulator